MNITPFLMFEGNAEEAMNFYVSLFKSSQIDSIQYYKQNEAGKEGSVMLAKFSLNGKEYKCIDSPAKHAFTFTPSMSLFVDCDSENEINTLFKELSAGGKVLMELGSYGFSQKYAWLEDRFGVSWQINLA